MAAWSPPAADAVWTPPAADAVSDTPAPSDLADPAAAADPDSTDPKTLFQQRRGYPAQSPEDLAEFMRDPGATPDIRKGKSGAYGVSMLTGLPKIALEGAPSTAVVGAVAGGLNALPALGGIVGDPTNASKYLSIARDRFRAGASAPYELADYLTAPITTGPGQELANSVLNMPVAAAKTLEPALNATVGEAATQSIGEAATDLARFVPALGAKGLAVRAGKGAAAAGRAVKGALTTPEPIEGTTYDRAGNAVPPPSTLTPPVGQPITGDTLRAQTNPIPPPDGTIAAAREKLKVPPRMATVNPAPEAPTEPAAPSATEPAQPSTQEPAAPPAPTAGAGTPSPGGAERGSVRVMNAPGEESAFDAMGRIIPGARLFTSPKDEGAQETPTPEGVAERTGQLNDLDALSGGALPSRRMSALTGDYNATGDDWQEAKTGNKTTQAQLASENDALHAAAQNVYQSVGSQFKDSVDSTTLENRGRTVRGALQGIRDHFEGMTDEAYDEARANSGDRPMPQFLKSADSFLKDDANYMPEGFRRAAQTRLQQLRTAGDAGTRGDGSDAAAPSSIGAAEKFREWLNANRTLDNMHTVRQLVDHTDSDVAEHGGPGLFQKARDMRTHQFRMVEEPKLVSQLLSAKDSQGINHSIEDHRVMDKIAEAGGGQHQRLLDVLRAGAHMSPELASSSAAAIREIQAHTLSRLHDAATNDGGKWNARTFYDAADRYGRNAHSTFADRPDIVRNLQTINRAGNTLHMDKSYPGAVGQAVRSTAVGTALGIAGHGLSIAAHRVPVVGGHIAAGIEGATEAATGKMSEGAREKAALSRLVDRNGKQRGSVRVMNAPGEEGALDILGRNPVVQAAGKLAPKKEDQGVRLSGSPQGVSAYSANGATHAVRRGNNLHVTGSETAKDARGAGEGNARLVSIADQAHSQGGKMHSGDEVSEPEQRRYTGPNGLAAQGYDVKTNPHTTDPGTGVKKSASELKGVYEVGPKKINVPDSQRGSVKVANEAAPEEGNGSMLNVGLHQGQEGQPGFRKMSKQEATGAVESTGAKVTKSSVLTPQAHGVAEPTLVASTDRPLSNPEMQSVLAKTKQSAIPQRTDAGVESMHIAPGHEAIAKTEGWDKFNPDYFREHDGRTLGSKMPKQGGWIGEQKKRAPGELWHGTPTGDLRGGSSGLHLGTLQAAEDALRARIGWPADGKPWDGTREYGKTLLAGKDTLNKLGPNNISGHNVDAPNHDYHISEHPNPPKYGSGERMPWDVKPSIDQYKITGPMNNSPSNPYTDSKANASMKGALKKGSAKNGYYYTNIGEDSGSVSAVVPNGGHVQRVPSNVHDYYKQRGSVRIMNEKPLEGAPEGDQPNGKARAAAAAYKKSAGIDTPPLKEYRYVDPKVAKNVADAYEEMKHDPTNPKVAKSYDAFKAETLAQYKQMVKAGVKVDLDPSYPYKNPREMHTDVRDNNHMSIYPTEVGFGAEGAAPADHPMLEKAPVKMGGKDATYNDLFRAVHDYYGHAAEGNGFRANGEYNAWRAHRQMYSDAARGAMDAETLGQNSWVNSGPPAALNKGASGAETIYADQKAGLLPPKVVKAAEEGVGADEHHVTNQLTDSERDQLRADTTKRLVDAFHGAPATEEYAAAALAGAAKRGWYKQSAQAIVNQFGHEAPRFAALLSAMSPQVSVQTNFANALKTYVNWDKAGRPEDPGAIRRIMEESSQKSATAAPGSTNVLDAWVNNAVRALTADEPSSVKLSGPKVHSFYNNLTNNVNEVTNDAWMASFAKIDPAKLGGSLNQSGPGKSPSYLALSAKVRDAARMISHLTGEKWTPAEVQETVWSWAKTAYEHAEEKGSNVSIPDLVKNGDITDELIRSTPDFHQLFGTSEHRGLLQSSRFARNDEELAHGEVQGTHATGPSQARAAAQESLRPHLISAAERLEKVRQERRQGT